MDLDQESKAGIGIDVNLRYVLAIRIELESMAFDCSRIARLIKSPNPW